MMKLLFISSLVAFLANQCRGQVVGVPRCSVAEADRFALCAAQPLVVNLNDSFPFDVASSNSYCRKAKSSIACMKAFSGKCLTDLPKQATSLVNYGMNKHIKNVCKSPESRREIGEKMKCNNQARSEMDAIMSNYVDMYRRVPFMATKDKLAGLCCAYYSTFEKLIAESRKHCSEAQAKYLYDFLHSFSIDTVELLCSNIAPNSATCRTIEYPEQTIGEKASVSVMPALLVTLETL
ncbi:hypothetical protein HDE_14541 [Halotydeus destructor]|nr:hypothetical protein HDE_14541 [Halotydeus destructor]